MIAYLKGKVLSVGADSAVVAVNGVGYEVFCSGSAFSHMSEGKECELYTHLQVSEQSGLSLYGFSTPQEKAMFLKLVSVSGVGPRMAIGVLTYMGIDDVATAVATGDVKRLSHVKGLGKKTAERIILELREKIALPVAGGVAAADIPSMPKAGAGDEDAIVALISLGFTRSESEKAVTRAKQAGATTVEDVIMQALRGM